MKWVSRALTKPSRCAVLPQIGATHELGYIDSGSELGVGDQWDQHVYVSVVGLVEMVKEMQRTQPDAGWMLPADVRDLLAELEQTVAERDEAVLGRDALAAKFSAIDVLASEGFRARNKPGRPPKNKVAA